MSWSMLELKCGYVYLLGAFGRNFKENSCLKCQIGANLETPESLSNFRMFFLNQKPENRNPEPDNRDSNQGAHHAEAKQMYDEMRC